MILMEWGEQMASTLAPERLEVHIDRPLDDGQDDKTAERQPTSDGTRVVTLVPVGFGVGWGAHLAIHDPDRLMMVTDGRCRLVQVAYEREEQMQATDGCTLVIDTSYGSTVGVVGHEPIVETDSRTHVEKLQVNIARAMDAAGLGTRGHRLHRRRRRPCPVHRTEGGAGHSQGARLRHGRLIGQNILDPQDAMLRAALRGDAVIADAVDSSRMCRIRRKMARRTGDRSRNVTSLCA